jgi:predicted nucleotidyltransferase
MILEKVKEFLKLKQGNDSMFNNIAHLALGGSHITKLEDETSDFDTRAIVILDEDYWIGLKSFDHDKLVSGKNGYNEFMDLDVEIFNVENFIYRLYKGEIVPAETIFVDEEYVLLQQEIIKPLINNRDLFISKKMAYNYCGGIKSYFHKITTPPDKLKRPDKILRATKYGFETKDAMKCIHYTQLLIEFLKEGQLNLFRKNYQELRDIKNGKYTLTEVLSIIQELDKEKEYLLKTSTLPETPDFDKINKFKKEYMKIIIKQFL